MLGEAFSVTTLGSPTSLQVTPHLCSIRKPNTLITFPREKLDCALVNCLMKLYEERPHLITSHCVPSLSSSKTSTAYTGTQQGAGLEYALAVWH